MSSSENGQFYKGLVFGVVLGAVAGALLAPEEGKKNREKLVKKLAQLKKDYAPLLKDLSQKAEVVRKDLPPAWREKADKLGEFGATSADAGKRERAKKLPTVALRASASPATRPRSSKKPRFFKGVR